MPHRFPAARWMRRPVLPAPLAVVLALAVPLASAAAESVRFSDALVPAGYPALERFGITAEVPRPQLFPVLVRAIHARPAETGGGAPALAALLADWDLVRQLHERLAAMGQPLSLTHAADGRSRQRLEAALGTAGLRLRERRRFYSVELDRGGSSDARRQALARLGVDIDAAVDALNGGGQIDLSLPAEKIPLPLDSEAWGTLLGSAQSPATLLPAVLASRPAALLAYGLYAVDDGTAAFLAAEPALLRRIHDDWPGSFAAFGRSLVVRDGIIATPGGAAFRPLWESLVGEPVDRPARFVARVLERDSGRLAYFYDAMMHLPPAGLRFALGAADLPVRARERQLEELYRIFASSDAAWSPNERPFARGVNAVDPAMLFHELTAGAGDHPQLPASRAVWSAVFGRGDLPAQAVHAPDDDDGGSGVPGGGGDLDAVWLARQVLSAAAAPRRVRFEQVLFASRVFGRDAQPLPDVVAALRGYGRFPAVMQAAERMGIRTPAVFAALARAAQALSGADDDVRDRSLFQFQGALALLGGLRRVDSITAPEAERLCLSLAALPLDGDGRYRGAVAVWLGERLLPALRPPAGDGPVAGSLDRTVIEALAGGDGRAARAFEIDGEPLRLSAAAYRLDRLVSARTIASGIQLDDVVSLARAIDGVRSGSDSLDSFGQALGPLRDAADAVASGLEGGVERQIVRSARNAIGELERIRRARDLHDAGRRLAALQQLADAAAADLLRTLAYLPHLAGSEMSATIGAVARRHDLGATLVGPEEARRALAWKVAAEVEGEGPWRLRGSLLGLGVPLARMSAPRLSTALPPAAPSVDRLTMDAIYRTFSLMNESDAAGDETVLALGRAVMAGRAAVHRAAGRGAGALSALAASVPMSGWRRSTLPWAARSSTDAVEAQFTLHELLAIGVEAARANGAGHADVDRPGASHHSVSGCLCTRLEPLQPLDLFDGNALFSFASAHAPELTLRIAEHLAALEVPARLLAPVMGLAVDDFIYDIRAVHDDDALAQSRAARRLTRERIEDYLAALAGRGMVRPAGVAGVRDRR